MQERVHAGNITELTLKYAFNSRMADNVPTVEELIEQKRQELQSDIEYYKQEHNNSGLKYAQTRFERFEEAINTPMPEGFELAVTLYSKVTKEQHKKSGSGLGKIISNARKTAAKNYSQELKALGICPYGIAEMEQGRIPCNTEGIPYAADWDHIVERNGAGKMPINDQANLILLPEPIHLLKNILRSSQQTHDFMTRNEGFMLSLVPNTPGMVAAAQPKGSPYELRLYEDTPQTRLRQAFHFLFRVEDTVTNTSLSSNEKKVELNSLKGSLTKAFNKVRHGNDLQIKKDLHKNLVGKRTSLLCDDLNALPLHVAKDIRSSILEVKSSLLRRKEKQQAKGEAKKKKNQNKKHKKGKKNRNRGNHKGPKR